MTDTQKTQHTPELLAAAPELLEALKAARYWLIEKGGAAWDSIQFHDSKQRVTERIEAAIAKATGEEVVT